MKNIEEIKNILSKHKVELREKYKIKEIGVFGSYARGEQRKGSDIDILVELEQPLGLKFINLADYLEEILGESVEVVTPFALKQKPRLWKSVKEDLFYV
jgi:predicted nucleotidyltransferase